MYDGNEGGSNSDANVKAVDTGDVIDDVNVSYATTAYVDGLIGDINSTLGDINSVLESIIKGEVGESKPINYGHIQRAGATVTWTLQFDLPVASTLQVTCGDAGYIVSAGNKNGGSYSLGPGESIGNTATVSPDEDDTYIYKIIIE